MSRKFINKHFYFDFDGLLLDNEPHFPIAYCPNCKKDIVCVINKMTIIKLPGDDAVKTIYVVSCCICKDYLNAVNDLINFRYLNIVQLKQELGYIARQG